MVTLNASTLFIYGLLTAAVLAVWLPPAVNRVARVPVWSLLAATAVVAALYYEVIAVVGLLYLAGLALLCDLTRRRAIHPALRVVFGLAVVAMVAALFLHAVPGFNNPLVFDQFGFGENSPPYSKHWNFDKGAAGLILLAFFGDIARTGRDWRALIQRSYPVTVATVVSTVLLAWAMGYIKPELSITAVYFLWAWANLFFTCVAEEMLFRGFAQKHLAALSANNAYKVAVVVVVGILFGLAHAAGGWSYVVLASVAGIGYGFAYHVTGRIEAAILTHFLLNSVHLLLFTYPYVQ